MDNKPMTIKDTPTRQQMIEWLGTEMGLAQTRALKSGDDTQFYRLKAIRDELLAPVGVPETELLTMKDGSQVAFFSNIPKSESQLEKEMHSIRRQSFNVISQPEPTKGEGK